jgi:oxygen-independent coproporphyrinogen-3 oxidase
MVVGGRGFGLCGARAEKQITEITEKKRGHRERLRRVKQLGRRLDLNRSLGVYISVPFCKAKCTYCNFASGVFAAERMDAYVARVCAEMRGLRAVVAGMGPGVELPELVDSVYFGGGTPSLLSAELMRRLFAVLRAEFTVSADAEVTLECAPGQLSEETLEEMLRQGMNRVSFGVQSFVDAEAKAVGRLHTREMCLAEIARMRAAGVGNLNVDLIAGLPGQTMASWRESVEMALDTGVPHVSVYMLEVDEDSRLGREMLGAGSRYGAGEVASEDEIAEWYGSACEWLEAGGVRQYEISNFAREGFASRHNVKYWRREPYLGFGLDAHSMLRNGVGGVRWANGDDLGRYEVLGTRFEGKAALVQLGDVPEVERIGLEKAFEEAMFLGLRMNEGVELEAMRVQFGEELMRGAVEALGDVVEAGLAVVEGGGVRLTARGRMASNEVFGRLLVGPFEFVALIPFIAIMLR